MLNLHKNNAKFAVSMKCFCAFNCVYFAVFFHRLPTNSNMLQQQDQGKVENDVVSSDSGSDAPTVARFVRKNFRLKIEWYEPKTIVIEGSASPFVQFGNNLAIS